MSASGSDHAKHEVWIDRLAVFIDRRARRVLVITAVMVVIAGGAGATVVGSLTNGGVDDPGTQSVRAGAEITQATGSRPTPEFVAVVRPPGGLNSSAGRAELGHVLRVIRRQPETLSTLSLLDRPHDSALVSRDGQSTYVAAFFRPTRDDKAWTRAARRIAHDLRGAPGVAVGGTELAFDQIDSRLATDLPKIELVAFSVLLVLSLIAFRGLVAALLPLFVGAVAIAGTLLVLRGVAELTSLSVFALNLVTGLGLGLAIDYSLFIVSRYREELARSGPGVETLRRTLATAGRTVLFSAATVSFSLLSLLVFPQPMLFSMGIAAALVAALAALAALIPLAAVLTLLGDRVNALAPARLQRSAAAVARPATAGGWYRLSQWVMRRAVAVVIGCSVLLIAIGLPALNVNLGSLGSKALPPSSSARQVDDALATQFALDETDPIAVVVHAPPNAAPEVARYAASLARLPNVGVASAPRSLGAVGWEVGVISAQPSSSAPARNLVAAIRAGPAPYAVGVTGRAASDLDRRQSLLSHLLLALAVLAASTLVVLFAMTGSVVLPIKSLLMNLLTLSGTFGLLVLIFQDGRLQGLLGFNATGTLEQTNMVILFIIAFALSTDYGVFLLARIKEAHDAGVPNREAVALGLERSGRVVTAAALLFCAAIGALVTSRIVYIKEFGTGAALAVLIDASIVRALLVPALMALLGPLNWWAPAPLRRLHSLVAARWHPGEVLTSPAVVPANAVRPPRS
jgi:RND superfamily putative drug exporter